MDKKRTWFICEYVCVTLIGVISAALFAVYLGQDINPDLVNYHFYSGNLSFNKDRLLTDVVPTNIQGYLNPYIYSIYFILYKIFPPKIVGAIVGGVHGLCFVSVYLVARVSLDHWPLHKARLASLLCAVFGLINPFYLSMLGASWSDNVTPILILPALAIVIFAKFSNVDNSNKIHEVISDKYILLLFSGLLIGFSVGFKLTNVAFVIGLIPAWMVGFQFDQRKSFVKNALKELIFMFGGIGVGFLIVNGQWMWSLWTHFQSPLFPFYNDVFKSKKIVEIWTNVPALAAAQNIWDYITYPFEWALGIPPETEWSFRDLRFAVIYALLFLFVFYRSALFLKFKLIEITPIKLRTPLYIVNRWGFILIWSGFSFLFWINQFGALRYLMPVTLLTGLVILFLLSNFIIEKNKILGVFIVILMLCSTIIRIPPYGRLSWDQTWYPAKLPEAISAEPAIYFNNGLSFVLPFFPEKSRFFGYMYLDPTDEFTALVKNEIKQKSLPLRTLTTYRWTPLDDAKLKMLSVRRNPYDCEYFEVAWAQYATCSVQKISEDLAPFAMPDFLHIDFNKIHMHGVLSSEGFWGPEPTGSWSVGPTAKINLLGSLPSQFNLVLTAYTFAKNSETGIDIIVGDKKKRISFGSMMKKVTIPYVFENGIQPGSSIRFEIPHPTSPSDLDRKSGDLRKLGIFIQSLEIGSPWAKKIDFSDISSQTVLKETSGFSIQEPSGMWTEGVKSQLTFANNLPDSFILSLRGATLPPNVDKMVTITIGKLQRKFGLSDQQKNYEFEFNIAPSTTVDKIELDIPFAISPKEIGFNEDTRKLGIFIERIKITPSEQ